MNLPNEFFTMNSFATLSGASGIVFMATSVIKYLTNGRYNPKWLAFVMSELVSFVGISLAVNTKGAGLMTGIIIGLLNGMLIFATALGINTVSTKLVPQEANAADSNADTSKGTKKITEFIAKDKIQKIVKPKLFFMRW